MRRTRNRLVIFTSPNNENRPSSPNFIDIFSKLITALVAAGGFIWGIIKFQEEQRFNETHEFRIRLWEKKLQTYSKLVDVTGNIIISRNDSESLDSLENEFDLLYYSSMIMVEDENVESKMIHFKEALSDFRNEIKKEQYLKRKQIHLIEAVKESLRAGQKLILDE